MDRFSPHLAWTADQRDRMLEQIAEWSAINTWSENVEGIHRLLPLLETAFAPLGGKISRIPSPGEYVFDASGISIHRPLGDTLMIAKYPDAPRRALLVIHTDTVYPPTPDYPEIYTAGKEMFGPGVADAKGGIAVMLIALDALERSPSAGKIGWTVVLNADEEIGSPGSAPLLRELAKKHHAGLVFEPALPDGAFVGARGGSGNFALGIGGKSAHVGRDFDRGFSAIVAAAEATILLHKMNDPGHVIVNIGKIDGGGPVNVVPDRALVRFNVRVQTLSDRARAKAQLERILIEISAREGIDATLMGQFHAPPKPMEGKTAELFALLAEAAGELGIPFATRPSNGVCDGNKLAAEGLPVVDTLGPVGDRLHSPDEFLNIDSLVPRAQLAATILVKLAERKGAS